MKVRALVSVLTLAALSLAAVPAFAQGAPVVEQPTVTQTPAPDPVMTVVNYVDEINAISGRLTSILNAHDARVTSVAGARTAEQRALDAYTQAQAATTAAEAEQGAAVVNILAEIAAARAALDRLEAAYSAPPGG